MSVGGTREFCLGLETGDLSSQLGVGVGGVACPVSRENEPKTNQDGCHLGVKRQFCSSVPAA